MVSHRSNRNRRFAAPTSGAKRPLQLLLLTVLFGTAIGLVACGERTTDMDIQMFHAKTVQEGELIRGREAYMVYCVGCHGESGDGDGPAATFLDPKPRDFTKGTYKYTGVASGDLARDEDLLLTLNRGLPASSMPTWKLIDEATKLALVRYVKGFSPWYADGEEGYELPVAPNPWRDDPDGAIARGNVVYHGLAGCYKCHPAYTTHDDIRAAAVSMETLPPEEFPADLYQEKLKFSDTWQFDVRPPDFTRRLLTNGNELPDLFRVIQSGVGGTAMPTWAGILEPNDIWAMSYYVRSLSLMRGTPEGDKLRKELGIR